MALTAAALDATWATALTRDVLRQRGEIAEALRLHSLQLAPLTANLGVISRYQASDPRALVGHHVLTLRFSCASSGSGAVDRQLQLILKAKAPGAVVRRRMAEVYAALSPPLAEAQRRVSPSILDACHSRELQLYAIEHPSLRAITPAIHRVWSDPEAQIFAVVMERLVDVRHADTLDQLDAWQPEDLACALTQLARVHGDFLAPSPLHAQLPSRLPSLLPFAALHDASLRAYQAELLRYNAATFPSLFSASRSRQLETLLAAAPARHRAIAARPLTLIHGDFTPRNICLKPGLKPGPMPGPMPNVTPGASLRLCAYDWELAQLHLPQRDVVELLCYVLSPARGWSHPTTAQLLTHYRRSLEAAAGRDLTAADFERDLALALAEFCTFKLLVQGITHQLLGRRAYFERLVHNAFDGLATYAAYLDRENAA